MTITRTVEVPADHKISLELPRSIPVGSKAQIELKVIPFEKKEDRSEKLHLTKAELDEILVTAKTPISDSLTGILAHLGNITIEQIREERLTRYIK